MIHMGEPVSKRDQKCQERGGKLTRMVSVVEQEVEGKGRNNVKAQRTFQTAGG